LLKEWDGGGAGPSEAQLEIRMSRLGSQKQRKIKTDNHKAIDQAVS